VERGDAYGQRTGEGLSAGMAPLHHVTINDHRHGQVVEVEVPQDRSVTLAARSHCRTHGNAVAASRPAVHA
jgi:hypothetical protein